MKTSLTFRLMAAVAALTLAGACGAPTDRKGGQCEGKCEGGGEAPNPFAHGYTPVAAEYQLMRGVNADILSGRDTELWAKVFMPSTAPAGQAPQVEPGRPLVVFLHGNHATCGDAELTESDECSAAFGGSCRMDRSCAYSSYGECPEGQVVVNNHHGYDYVGRELAKRGYVVVSINANLGITCARGGWGDGGLNLARGRLVLKHLEMLAAWNNDADGDYADSFFPLPAEVTEIAGVKVNDPTLLGALAGKLDFGNVGMMGHSRGGEGVRAAYVQYTEDKDGAEAVDSSAFDLAGSRWSQKIAEPVGFKAILEIGPVDGQTGRTVDAFGVPWAVILPMCDGDVSNLAGMKPFDRMLANTEGEAAAAPKAMLAVWGTNHNFFNTEWQSSDSHGCSGPGHAEVFRSDNLDDSYGNELPLIDQQKIGLASMLAFFKAHVGNPWLRSPEMAQNFDPFHALSSYFASLSTYERSYADSSATGGTVVLKEYTTEDEGSSTVSEHDGVLRATTIEWNRRDPETEELLETPPSAGVSWPEANLGETSGMTTLSFRLSRHKSDKAEGPSDFSIMLVDADGVESPAVSLSTYATLLPAVGGSWGVHYVLQTVRVPLSAFADVQLNKITGMKLVFDKTETGKLYLASVRASMQGQPPAPVVPDDPPVEPNLPVVEPNEPVEPPVNNGGNVVVTNDPGNGRDPGAFAELRFAADQAFWVGGALPVLEIGPYRFATGGYPSKDDVGTKIDFTRGGASAASVQQLHNLNNIVFRVPLGAKWVSQDGHGRAWPGFYQVSGDHDVRIVYGAERGQKQVSWSFGKLSSWR